MKDPGERARAVMVEARGGPIVDVSPERTERLIAASIREAVIEEREACARECEAAYREAAVYSTGYDCARRIRARGKA